MTEFNNNFEHELGWDDEIKTDSGFIDLPDGLYRFTVTNIERGRHTPNPDNKKAKLPPCNKATVSIEIETKEGVAELKHNLFLHTSTEGMLSAFFGAIGQKKKGEPLKMNWNIIGAKGVCKIGHEEYNGNNYNRVKSMIYQEDVDYTKVLNNDISDNQNQYSQQAAQNTYQTQQSSFFQGNSTQFQQPNQTAPQQPVNNSFGGF